MLAADSLFNLYIFSVKYIYSLFSRADSDLSALKNGLSLFIYAVYIQTEIMAQVIYMSFICIMYDTNIYRITSLCQTD